VHFEVDQTWVGATRAYPGAPLTIFIRDLEALVRYVERYGSVRILRPRAGSTLYRLQLGA
jgi:hypothetical protein